MTAIPLAAPGVENGLLAEELAAAANRVRESGRYVLGPEVEAFEREFAQFAEARFAVGVASGTDALMLALAACGVGGGDEVVTASHTAGATAAAILHAGATLVLADIDPKTLTLSAKAAEAALTPRTRAIVPVHLYGGAADLSAIRDLARSNGLAVIEDCAQAHGTRYDDQHVGAQANAAAFSFYPTKNLGALGDGGAVTTSDPDVAQRLRLLRQYGWEDPQVSVQLGWNSRLDELQAAMLRVKLAHLPASVGARRAIAAAYRRGIDSDRIVHPETYPGVEHSFHLYVVRTIERDGLAAHLRGSGIATGVHYPVPVHRQAAYAARAVAGPLAETELASNEIISLPLFPGLTSDALERVVAAVNAY